MPLTNKDRSPSIPLIGAISESSLLQRRANSKEGLDISYYRYDEYDNISLVSLSPKTVQKPQNNQNSFSYTNANR